MNKRIPAAVLSAALALGCTACGSSAASTPAKTTTITIWTYYNGNQLDEFNQAVDEFNRTAGAEKGIVAEAFSQGSVTDLEANVMNAAEGKVGAEELPNLFCAYADTAYELDQMGLVIDLTPYFTEEERAAYIEGYLAEGDFDGTGSLKIFPTAKSTEVLFLNDTDWQPFAQATGAEYDDLATVEGLVHTAQSYYEWSSGKALFGRDAMANYMLVGAKELGDTVFDAQDGRMTLRFDKDTMHTLWDNYYVPFVKGYFAADGKFRSDDIKTGSILAYVGSSSSASYFPGQVSTSDTESHDIELKVLPSPHFAGYDKVSVQQGAGMVVTKGDDAAVQASVEFLKWFTAPENNISFSVGSGYLPVTYEASSMQAVESSGLAVSDSMNELLSVAFDTVTENELYTPRAFQNGQDARAAINTLMSDAAQADRTEVLARMEEGQSQEEACAEFLTEEHFDDWYQAALESLEAYEG